MKKITVPVLLLASFTALVFTACSKDSSKSTTLRVRMTDNPFNADEVNVDIQKVRVNFNSDTVNGWTDLDTHAGVYDLLGLQNGVDTLLAAGVIPSDVVKEIRFVLGSNNTIKVNGIVYPLTVPSGAESGLKLKINKQLNGSLDSLLIDFDAALSIHQVSAGDYQLRPVLKIK